MQRHCILINARQTGAYPHAADCHELSMLPDVPKHVRISMRISWSNLDAAVCTCYSLYYKVHVPAGQQDFNGVEVLERNSVTSPPRIEFEQALCLLPRVIQFSK